jgi:hypothetical protein
VKLDINITDNSPKVGAIGVKFTIDVGEDLTGATTTNLIFQKPDGTEVTKAGSIENLNYITYTTTTADELDQEGQWSIIASVVKAGFTGYGKTLKCLVLGKWG